MHSRAVLDFLGRHHLDSFQDSMVGFLKPIERQLTMPLLMQRERLEHTEVPGTPMAAPADVTKTPDKANGHSQPVYAANLRFNADMLKHAYLACNKTEEAWDELTHRPLPADGSTAAGSEEDAIFAGLEDGESDRDRQPGPSPSVHVARTREARPPRAAASMFKISESSDEEVGPENGTEEKAGPASPAALSVGSVHTSF